MKNPKIGIIGYFDHGNAGDEVMKNVLLEEFPNSVAGGRKDIEKCDAYIIAGGDLVQEFTGLHFPHLWEKIADEPCYALSLGVKPGWVKHKEKVIRYLSKFRMIYTREQESFDVLSKYVKVSGVMPDLVLLIDAPKSQEKYPILFNYTDRDWLNPDGQFKNILKCSEMLPVALSPEYDNKYSSKLVTYEKFLSMAKSSLGVISTRLHGVVAGAVAQVPVAAIAYEGKVKKFCLRYQIPYFDYGVKNGEEIISGMKVAKIDLQNERQKIQKIINSIKSDLEKYFNQ